MIIGVVSIGLVLSSHVGADVNGDPACAKSFITLHKGAGSQFPISWKVPRFMPFLKLESKGGWVKVRDVDGEIHYAQARDLTNSVSCVVVKNPIATLRQSASAASPTADLKTVDRYTPFKKIELQGDWVYIEDEAGRHAWVHESNIWRPVKIQAVEF